VVVVRIKACLVGGEGRGERTRPGTSRSTIQRGARRRGQPSTLAMASVGLGRMF
jgi:hypothetical protein